MAWQKLETETLSSSNDDITISGFTSKICNVILSHLLGVTANIAVTLRLGSGSVDSGSNYTNRFSTNGSADSTNTSQTSNNGFHGSGNDSFAVCYIMNIAAEEKLMIGWNVVNFTTGAGTAPSRRENGSKWVNTSNQFDNTNFNNTDSGSYDTDSNLTGLGTD